MFKKLGLFVFVLTILQVSARFKNVISDVIDDVDEINPEPASLSSSRIVSGWLAEPGQHPHHAALQMRSASGGIWVCGGSLISNEWVLTSARCVVRKLKERARYFTYSIFSLRKRWRDDLDGFLMNWKEEAQHREHWKEWREAFAQQWDSTGYRVLAVVRLGVVDINDNNPDHIYETSEWYTHPNFNNLSTALQSHGVTLLKLPRPVVYSRLVKPIRIQSSADAFRNYDGEQVYASGHGYTNTFGPDSRWLRWVYLRAISNEECRKTSTAASFNTVICARYYNVTSQSTCYNDNGGPLVYVGSDGIPTLIGITFFFPSSNIGCDVGRPTGFYRPGAFLSWIKEVTGIDFDTTSTTTPTTTIPTTTTPTTTPTTTSTTTTPTPTSTTATSTTTSTSTTTAPTTTTTTPIPTTIPSTTTTPPDEEKEEEEDSDGSECNDDEMGQLLKRLQVDVKVKVALNKYKMMKMNDTSALYM